MRSRSARLVPVALAVLLVAGCGGGSGGTPPPNKDPRAEALSYMPRDAPAIVELTTDPGSQQIKAALVLLRRFPFGGGLLSGLQNAVQAGGASYEQGIKPVLGNPVVIAPLITQGAGGGRYILSFVGRNAAKLSALVTRDKRKLGDHAGFALYRSGSGTSIGALKGSVFLLSRSRSVLEAAIDRRNAGQGARASDVDALAAGLPARALIRVTGDVEATIARTAGDKAKRVPFVRALKGYAATLTAASKRLVADVRLDTSGATLRADDRPLIDGDDPPQLLTRSAVALGAQDPAHLLRFVVGVGRAINPQSYAGFTSGLAQLKARSGLDLLGELRSQLSGEAQEAGGGLGLGVRVTVKDPGEVRRDVLELRPFLGDLLGNGAVAAAGPNGLTVVRRAGRRVLSLGVVGDQLVFGRAPPADLVGFATRVRATPLRGAHGTIALRLGIVPLLLDNALPFIAPGGIAAQIARGVADRVGDVTGYASEDAGELRAHVEVRVR